MLKDQILRDLWTLLVAPLHKMLSVKLNNLCGTERLIMLVAQLSSYYILTFKILFKALTVLQM